MARLTPPIASGLTIRAARVIGGKTAGGRDRLRRALGHISLSALGIGPGATLVLDRMAAPRPLTEDEGTSGDRATVAFARALEDQLRLRAARARRSASGAAAAGGGGDWLFEDADEVEAALVAAALAPGPRPAWVRALTGAATPDIVTRWRRHILTDGVAAARLIARLAEAPAGADAGTEAPPMSSGATHGLAVAWLARFEPHELAAAAARIRVAHGGPAGIGEADLQDSDLDAACPAVGDPTPPHAAPLPAAPVASPPAARNLAATLAALAPEAGAAPAGSSLRALLVTALAANRRPTLLALPAFAHAAMAPLAPGLLRRPAATAPAISAAAPPAPDLPDAAPAQAIATQFAGMGFLLNAFVALGLFGDFTHPDDTLAGLSPFELLILLGRHWYGAAFVADPLHDALRRAAGLAPREPAGRHFATPAWTVPPAWLAPWEAGAAPGSRRRRPGFPLVDPRGARSSASRRRFWVAALSRYLAARLALAVGDASPHAARDLVCRRPGVFILASETLTLRMALADHPLAIRMAGLDRDPGRLAGAGRSVLFEFTL